jgi:hypothetical protein
MINKTDQIDPEAWKDGEKTLWYGCNSPVGLGLFIIAVGIAIMAAVVALLHVAEVIP